MPEVNHDAAPSPAILPSFVTRFSLFTANDLDVTGLGDIVLPIELQDAVPRRQLHFRAGRLCARIALRRLNPDGSAPGASGLTVSRDGEGVPIWPDGITGSITHTDGFASAAAAWTRDTASVGIDSERIMSASRRRDVASVITVPAELEKAYNAGLTELEATTLAFCAKEALFKAVYPLTRSRFWYHDARLILVDATQGMFRLRLQTTLGAGLSAGATVSGSFSIDGQWVHTGLLLPAGASSTDEHDGAQQGVPPVVPTVSPQG